MARIIFLFCAMASFVMTHADTFSYRFKSTPLPHAIQRVMEDHPNLDVNFIYNELENYSSSSTVNADNPYDALRQAIGFNPVSVVKVKDTYYIEALQHGKYIYTGRAVDLHNEPVVAATVMLLSPKDSTVLTYGTTNESGRFRIPCDKNEVIGKFTCVGYKPAFKLFNSFAVGDVLMSDQPVLLKTVTVKGNQMVNYSDRNVYLPTQRQKRTAMDAVDLLRRMAIPQLNIKIFDKSVETSDGQPVALFIDYVRASAEELRGMRTADVKKVEFSYSPSDPRFMGEINVVNFILQKYEFGGYTKLTTNESLFTGLASDASVYSKFNYKRMTYDMYVASANSNNHHNGSSGTSSYLLTPEGEESHWVERTQTLLKSHYAKNSLPVTLRATYNTDNFQMKNTVGFTYTETPSDDSEGKVEFSPELFKSSSTKTEKSSDVKSVSYNGYYFFSFPNNYSLTLYPSATYTHNVQNSFYTTDVTAIRNNARENTTDLNIDGSARKKLNDNNYLYLSGFAGRTEYRVKYYGNYPAKDKLVTEFGGGTLKYGYYTDKISADVRGGVRYQRNVTNDVVETEFYPFGTINAGWSPSRSHSLNFSVNYSKEIMPDNGKSPNVLQENELLYYRGNPNLHCSHMIGASLRYNWRALPWLRISAFGNFLGLIDRWTPVYSPYKNGTAVLRSYENNGDHFWTYFGFSATASFLDNNLQFNINPRKEFYHTTGAIPVTYQPTNLFASVQYYLGDFYFSAYYNARLTSLWSNYDTIIRTKWGLELEAGWSVAAWNLRFTLTNPFRRSWEYSNTRARYAYFSDNMINYSTSAHFQVKLTAAYTFGYGRKVKQGDEVGGSGIGSSAILK
ncbi:MAG: TonB-dependent receptor family protein [Duncaniella sp.]|nr:TonB-dependent receptor family protein [Duncaniella sp.]